MRVSDPILVVNQITFAPELTLTVSIPLEPIADLGMQGGLTEQEYGQMIGQEVMKKIKERRT